MNNISEKKKKRIEFLNLLYEKSNDDIHKAVIYSEISQELNLDDDESYKIFQYLKEKGLAHAIHLGGGIGITQLGIDEVEMNLSVVNEEKANQPSVINYIQIGQMHNSQIIQGSSNIKQTNEKHDSDISD